MRSHLRIRVCMLNKSVLICCSMAEVRAKWGCGGYSAQYPIFLATLSQTMSLYRYRGTILPIYYFLAAINQSLMVFRNVRWKRSYFCHGRPAQYIVNIFSMQDNCGKAPSGSTESRLSTAADPRSQHEHWNISLPYHMCISMISDERM